MLVLGNRTNKEEKPAGQAKQNHPSPRPPFLVQGLDPLLILHLHTVLHGFKYNTFGETDNVVCLLFLSKKKLDRHEQQNHVHWNNTSVQQKIE